MKKFEPGGVIFVDDFSEVPKIEKEVKEYIARYHTNYTMIEEETPHQEMLRILWNNPIY